MLDIDAKTSGSLVWVGNNPTDMSLQPLPLIIHILLNNITGSYTNINLLSHPSWPNLYSIRAVNIESDTKFKALI
jgi:hypothetical protein